MTFKGLQTYVRSIERLPQPLRRAIEVAFLNPTDAADVAFEAFLEADAMEELCELIDTALDLDVDNADVLEDRLTFWMHEGECTTYTLDEA